MISFLARLSALHSTAEQCDCSLALAKLYCCHCKSTKNWNIIIVNLKKICALSTSSSSAAAPLASQLTIATPVTVTQLHESAYIIVKRTKELSSVCQSVIKLSQIAQFIPGPILIDLQCIFPLRIRVAGNNLRASKECIALQIKVNVFINSYSAQFLTSFPDRSNLNLLLCHTHWAGSPRHHHFLIIISQSIGSVVCDCAWSSVIQVGAYIIPMTGNFNGPSWWMMWRLG